MGSKLFVDLVLAEGPLPIQYQGIYEVLEDLGLRCLFEDGLVERCIVSVIKGDTRVDLLRLPRPLCQWQRFREEMVSKAKGIVEATGPE